MAITRQLFPKWKWLNLIDDVRRLEWSSSVPWMQSWLAERGRPFCWRQQDGRSGLCQPTGSWGRGADTTHRTISLWFL